MHDILCCKIFFVLLVNATDWHTDCTKMEAVRLEVKLVLRGEHEESVKKSDKSDEGANITVLWQHICRFASYLISLPPLPLASLSGRREHEL